MTDGSSFISAIGRVLYEAPTIVLVAILCLVIGGFVTHLSFYHTIVILWLGMSTYESKKDHFLNFTMGNPYQAGHRRCYLLCRRRVTKFYSFTEDEQIQVLDSDRRCSLKVVTKDKERLVRLSRPSGFGDFSQVTNKCISPLSAIEKDNLGISPFANLNDP